MVEIGAHKTATARLRDFPILVRQAFPLTMHAIADVVPNGFQTGESYSLNAREPRSSPHSRASLQGPGLRRRPVGYPSANGKCGHNGISTENSDGNC